MASFELFFRHTALFILRLSIQIKCKINALSDEKIASKSTHSLFLDKSNRYEHIIHIFHTKIIVIFMTFCT
jgi:hypothetical protein